jgi:predicted GNAT superfamily acetyltransferase
MKLGPVTRLLVSGALALSVLLVVMSLRAFLEARAHAGHAQLAQSRGDLAGAIVSLRLSARWDSPFNLYAERSFASLERIARAAEARGDTEQALTAYRAVHAAALSSRGFFVPQHERLARVDPRIEQLRLGAAAQGETHAGMHTLDRRDYLAALMPDRPRPLGVVIAWAGFAAWVGGASVFLRRGVDAQGRLVRRVARQGAVFALLGWIAFALGLRIA